jgi:hypothetical protein
VWSDPGTNADYGQAGVATAPNKARIAAWHCLFVGLPAILLKHDEKKNWQTKACSGDVETAQGWKCRASDDRRQARPSRVLVVPANDEKQNGDSPTHHRFAIVLR